MSFTEPPRLRGIASRLTAEQREDISQRYLDGEPASRLATEYGVSVATLRNFLPTRPKTYAKEF